MARQSTMPRSKKHFSTDEIRTILKEADPRMPEAVVDYIEMLPFRYITYFRQALSKLEKGTKL